MQEKIQALSILPCNSIIVSQPSVKKRLQYLIESQEGRKREDLVWEFMKQHEIKEDYLINVLGEQASPLLLWIQPKGPCYNQPGNILSMIVPQKGNSLILVNGCDILLVDPCENIEKMLKFYGLPLNGVRAVLVTKANNLNVYECLMKFPKLCLIAEQRVYFKVKQLWKKYFFVSENMWKSRVTAKIVVQKQKKHKFKNMEWLVHDSKNGQSEYWQISLGISMIRIYHRTLNYFPQELISNVNFEYGVFNEIQDNIKKKLQQMPEVFRKKVIYNRLTRKYNNKYFVKLQETVPYVSIEVELKKVNSNKNENDLAFQLKEKDVNAQLIIHKMKENEKINSKGRIVHIRSGFVEDQIGQLKRFGESIVGNQIVKCVKRANIMYEPEQNIYFYHKYKNI